MSFLQKFADTHKGKLKGNQKLYAFLWGLPLYRKVLYSLNSRTSEYVKRSGVTGISAFYRRADMIRCLWRYGCTYAEYDLYNFSKLNHIGRKEFIGDCCRKKYYMQFNSIADIDCFRNKNLAYQEFAPYYGRQASAFCVADGFDRFCEIINCYGTAMVKPATASGGYGIMKVSASDADAVHTCYERLSTVAPDAEVIIEEYIEQVPELKALHPASLNTVRIITVLDCDGCPHILGAFFRVGVNGKVVDNGASGGILCKLDHNGTIIRCLNKDGTEYIKHPDTSYPLVGFTIPQWESAKLLAQTLATKKTSIRFCGWDLALSPKGWIMIEGNESSEFIGIQIFGDGCKKRIMKYL